MLNHPTQDLMQRLGFEGMVKGFKDLQNDPESQALDHQEWLGLLLDYEATSRHQKRFERRLRAAKLRQAASVEDINYRASRGLDRALFQKLATNDWIRKQRNLLITGPCGVGKSYLACALGQKACRDDISVVYHRVPRLFQALALARGDGRYARVLRAIAKIRLLILDDWGPEPLNADQRRDLLEIVEDRYDAGSILITSQLPLENWHEIIGDPTIADAILDRVVHNAHRIELRGESLRKKRDQDDQA
jgi:DNA replication protein DnaC